MMLIVDLLLLSVSSDRPPREGCSTERRIYIIIHFWPARSSSGRSPLVAPLPSLQLVYACTRRRPVARISGSERQPHYPQSELISEHRRLDKPWLGGRARDLVSTPPHCRPLRSELLQRFSDFADFNRSHKDCQSCRDHIDSHDKAERPACTRPP